MNDTQDEIFQAFIVGLYQQTEPLPADVQSEFNKTDETCTINDILRLTKLHPPLLEAYQKNRVWLKHHSSQRSKGFPPNAESEINNTTSTEIPNTARDNSDLTKLNLPELLDKMESEIEPGGWKKLSGKIVKAKDSVQASLDTILSLIADGFSHE
jgi:hypothetical protein